jgi:hypothetical protein
MRQPQHPQASYIDYQNHAGCAADLHRGFSGLGHLRANQFSEQVFGVGGWHQTLSDNPYAAAPPKVDCAIRSRACGVVRVDRLSNNYRA